MVRVPLVGWEFLPCPPSRLVSALIPAGCNAPPLWLDKNPMLKFLLSGRPFTVGLDGAYQW